LMGFTQVHVRKDNATEHHISVAERSFSLCDRTEMFIKPVTQPILRQG
jgi:hypothetical protein